MTIDGRSDMSPCCEFCYRDGLRELEFFDERI
jgi:hypothetical protein